MKKRLDLHLYEVGFFESRHAARSAIMAGQVSVDGKTEYKPGKQVTGKEEIRIKENSQLFVSRGGVKLDGVLDKLGVDPFGKDILDVGASTGGFTDCLLKRGARRVIALDVGKGQLHWKLRNDDRVFVLEGVNARYLKREELPFVPDLAVIDVSFISLEKVLEPVAKALKEGSNIVVLFKPQFEAGRGCVGKGGVIKDKYLHVELLDKFWMKTQRMGLGVKAISASPIRGHSGNIEYFLKIGKGESIERSAIEEEVFTAFNELE